MVQKFVVVRKALNTVSCMGVFDNYETAFGTVMNFIFKLKKISLQPLIFLKSMAK